MFKMQIELTLFNLILQIPEGFSVSQCFPLWLCTVLRQDSEIPPTDTNKKSSVRSGLYFSMSSFSARFSGISGHLCPQLASCGLGPLITFHWVLITINYHSHRSTCGIGRSDNLSDYIVTSINQKSRSVHI